MTTPDIFLADGPARDQRFNVVEHWIDCANFPPGDGLREFEFLHRQMNEEIDSLECSARNLSDFANEPWELRMDLAHQCADEARHAALFRRTFEARGGRVGQYPVLNFQYRIVTKVVTLVGRLAVQNRCFEAGGLDAIKSGIETSLLQGDHELAGLFESQQADEIAHVRFANKWIRAATQADPRAVLHIGAALNLAAKAFSYVMGTEGVAGASHPADAAGREEAGFTTIEIQQAVGLQLRNAAGRVPATP